MNQQPSNSEPQTTQDPQQISKWARAYAQNRSLGVVIFLAIFLLLSAAIGGSSYLAGEAYRSDNMLLFWVAIAMLVPALAAVAYFANPYWGGKFQERMSVACFKPLIVVSLKGSVESTLSFGSYQEDEKWRMVLRRASTCSCTRSSVCILVLN